LHRHFGWKVGLPAYGLATYVAASRLQENRHFASDVIFGAAIGIVAGRTVTVGRGRGTFTVAPVALRGGAAVMFTRVP
jgi:membrane-associated phospholipid phosphatase